MAAEPTRSELIADAARGLLSVLDGAEAAEAQFPFEVEGERTTFFYTPTDHGGVRFTNLDPIQQQAALRLVAASVSDGAFTTIAVVMGWENVLAGRERFRNLPFHRDPGIRSRDPSRYYVAIFGEPGSEAWGWRLGGHHVSLSVTVVGESVYLQPFFIGIHPTSARGLGQNALRPLAAEEDLGRELVVTLSDSQRDQAVISREAPSDIVSANRARLNPPLGEVSFLDLLREPPESFPPDAPIHRLRTTLPAGAELDGTPRGLPISQLSAPQLKVFDSLLHQYLDRMPSEMAQAERGRIAELDQGELAFAWAGDLEPKEPHYYRIEGPGLLIEYDNVQSNTDHIHTVWRDPRRDFGFDLLAAHYAEADHSESD